MRLRVLGCSGGIGGQYKTTTMLLDDDVLIDAGTGVGELSIADFAILGWVWRHPRHQVDLTQFPHVKRWFDQLMARPAVQRGFAVALK